MWQETNSQEQASTYQSPRPDVDTAVDFFATSMEHLLAELERIDVLVQARILSLRKRQGIDEDYRGLYISEAEVDALLAQPVGAPHWATAKRPSSVSSIDEAVESLRAKIETRKAESLQRGILLRFHELSNLFALRSFERDVVLLCLAPELDRRYERLYAYIQDDVTKKYPAVDLALTLFVRSFQDRVVARRYFASESALIRNKLISLFQDSTQYEPTLLSKFLKLDQRITEYLLGSDSLDHRLQTYVELAPNIDIPDEVILEENRLQRIVSLTNSKTPMVLYLQGPYGVGKQTTAQICCANMGMAMLCVDLRRLLSLNEEKFAGTLHSIDCEAALQHAVVYWNYFDTLLQDELALRLALFLKAIEKGRYPCFLAGETTWEPKDALQQLRFLRIEFAPPDFNQRTSLWSHAFSGLALATDVDTEILAGKFRFSGGQIQDAVATARNLAHWRDPQNQSIGMAELNVACRLQSNRKLAQLAQKIEPRYHWEDIVLPAKKQRQLKDCFNAAKYSAVVYSKWGFGEKLSLGKGVNILFSGPSGTGKTMAAEIFACELSLALYKIDLSSVVSKFIGETEKNLSRIFTEAETANAILFFDEADALFGKRSEVRDSHDRYANIEIGYLLQRMEEYEGIVILATNLGGNMDEAFMRRMHFIVEFPFPGEKERLRIWKNVWPQATPMNADIDLEFIAKQVELAGGNIKNIALGAAFLAADEGGGVAMKHLIRAIQREYEKMGKVIMHGEFGKFWSGRDTEVN